MAISWSPSDTLTDGIIDNLETVRVVVRGAPVANDDGTVTYTSTNYDSTTAKRLRVTMREAETSGGKLTTEDVKFHVSNDDLTVDPSGANNTLLAGSGLSETWRIIHVDRILHASRYRIYCRGS